MLPPGRAPPPRPIYSTAVPEGQVHEQAWAIGTRPGAVGTPIDDTTARCAAWAWCKQMGEVGRKKALREDIGVDGFGIAVEASQKKMYGGLDMTHDLGSSCTTNKTK